MDKQLKYVHDTISFISKNGYETDHIKFLKSTAVFLAELFKVNYVFIDKYSINTSDITETVVLYGNGCFIQNLLYNLENTPCDNIINKKLCSYPVNVKNIFPKDNFLRQNNIESYIGKPLWNSKKEPIGLIAFMDTKNKSLSEENNIAIVLDIIAIKIEEVLEKMLFENQLNLKINELIIAKEVAQGKEEKFKKLANLIFEGILISENGVAVECNRVFLKMFGYSTKEILGKSTINILYPEKYHKKIVENSLKKHTPPYEIEGIRKDGTFFPVEIEARNIDLGNNKINRLVTFRDLSSRKKAQIENKKLITAIEQSANTVVITDIYGNIEYTNPKFTEVTGYTAAEAYGKNPRILNSGAQPKEFYTNLWQTISGGNIWKGQMKNITKSEKFYWEQVTITPIKDETGKITNYLAIKEDISNNKEDEEKLLKATEEIEKSERKFRELFEKSGDAILIIKNGIFTDCNQATLDLLGYKKFEDVLNFHPSKLSSKFQPDGLSSFGKAEAEIEIALEKGTHRFEWWHTKSSKEIFPVEVLLTTIENEPNNKIIHCVWRDITDRKNTEEQLQKQNEEYKVLFDDYLTQNTALKQLSNQLSEKNRLLLESKDRFINLFEQNPVPLWEQDFSKVIRLLNEKKAKIKELKNYLEKNPDFVEECISNIKILNANKAALELFGVKNTEELKIHLGKTNTKKAIEVLKKELVSIGSTKKTFSDETELAGKDGSTILALVKSVIIDDYGTSIASVIDITAKRNATNELKKAKEITEKSENSLNEAQKIAHIGSYDLDFSTGYWNSSPTLNDIFGIDEKFNRNINGWLGMVHPQDLQMMERYLKKNIVVNREEFNIEYRIIRNTDKQMRWVHGLGKLELDSKGNLKRLIGTIQDISEKKQILDALIIAKENAEDSENNLKKRAKELLGIFTLHQLIEKNADPIAIYTELVTDIIPKSMQFTDKVYCSIEINNEVYSNNKKYKIPAEKNYLSQKIWVNKKQVGELKVAYTEDLQFVELYEPNLVETCAQKISVFLDKRDLFEKLLNSKEKAEESDRLKTEFIQNMSHEIRTPMNGILGFSELLDNPDLTNEKRVLFIDIIKNCTHQLLHIIDDIMEISVLETKQIRVEENPVCLNELLHELYSVFNIKATNKNIALVLKNGLTNRESAIITDINKLNKVLSNLLENALKFTDEGFVELGYKLNKDSEPTELEIYVKDSGIGIKPEKHKLIFDRFSQAEKDLSKNVGGLGLGLSIAKENAELLGGKITVVSEHGEGAIFFVSIPYKPVNITAEIIKENEKISKKKGKYTILIAEDEDINFMVLEILLLEKIKLSCTIIHAKNGLEAVELSKTNLDIGLVLMDIKMPKMDGHEATKRIKEFRPNLPIIAQTAYSTSEEKERAFLAGSDDFMAKPISKDALYLVISKYLLENKNNRDR